MTSPQLSSARSALEIASGVIAATLQHLRSLGSAAHDDQATLYAVSHAAAAVAMANSALDRADDEAEIHLAHVLVGRVLADMAGTLWSQHERWGAPAGALDAIRPYVAAATAPDFVADAASLRPPAGLPDDLVWLLGYLFDTVLDGRNSEVMDGVERALGRPPRDFRDYAQRIAARGTWDVDQQEVA